MSLALNTNRTTTPYIELQSNSPWNLAFSGQDAVPELNAMTIGFYMKVKQRDNSVTSSNVLRRMEMDAAPFYIVSGNQKVGSRLVCTTPATTNGLLQGLESEYTLQTYYNSQPSSTFGSPDVFYDDFNIMGDWVFYAITFNFDGGDQAFMYLIDPADGTTLLTENAFRLPASDTTASPFTSILTDTTQPYLQFRSTVSNDPAPKEYSGAGDTLIAEVCFWNEVKTEAALQAFAQVGFASINEPSGLVLDWNFMKNWTASNAAVVPDDSPNGNDADVLVDAAIVEAYNVDAPVPIFILQEGAAEFDSYTFNVFSASTGTARIGAWPSGTPVPSQADVFAGTGAVLSTTFEPDGIAALDVVLSGLTTGTEYEIFAVQDRLNATDYTPVQQLTVTTPTKYSETLVDVSGNNLASVSSIQYAWYDSVDANNLGTAKVTGTTEATDGVGLMEVTLPTSITTAKGAQGTMVLKVDDGGTIRTASHIVTVK